MTEFRYLTAAEWGGTWTTSTPPVEKVPDGEAFLHHVGGAAWMGGTVALSLAASRAAAIAVFRGLNEYAKRPRDPKNGTPPPPGGWGKGYQFLDYDALGWYDRFNDIGWIGEGRGKYRSAATLDRNEEGEAFCICGNFSARQPLPPEIELCARGLAYMAEQGWTTQTPKILGHKDNPAHPLATGCPGDHLYPHLPTIRSRFTALTAPVPPTPPEDDMVEPNRPPLDRALGGAALVAEYLACNPGGGAQAAFWDTVLPWMTGKHIPAGDPRRTEAEMAAKFPGDGRWARAWAAVIA